MGKLTQTGKELIGGAIHPRQDNLCAERARLSLEAKQGAWRFGAVAPVNAAGDDPVRKPDAGNLPVRFE
jgi:hypothetical protein